MLSSAQKWGKGLETVKHYLWHGKVEIALELLASNRFVKKQQMQWTPKGAHLLLQTRICMLDDDLEEIFREWHPQLRAETA